MNVQEEKLKQFTIKIGFLFLLRGLFFLRFVFLFNPLFWAEQMKFHLIVHSLHTLTPLQNVYALTLAPIYIAQFIIIIIFASRVHFTRDFINLILI